jgi:hypothetical protein
MMCCTDRSRDHGGIYLISYIGMSGVLERLLVITCVYIWEEQRCFALLLALRRCVRASLDVRGSSRELEMKRHLHLPIFCLISLSRCRVRFFLGGGWGAKRVVAFVGRPDVVICQLFFHSG